MAQVISFLNQKGGVGKTTLAFNLAHALANKNHRVLALDMDPQANLSLLCNVSSLDEEFNIFHLLINSIRELKSLHTGVHVQDLLIPAGAIDVLPAGQELSGFELTVAGINSPRQLILNRFMEKSGIREMYDYIVIDGPPTLGLNVVNILCASDGLLIPFQPDQFSHTGLINFNNVLEDVEDMGVVKAPKVLGYIPNLVENRRKQTKSDFEDIQSDLGARLVRGKMFDAISNRVQLTKSGASKKSVFDFKTKDYKELQNTFLDMASHIEQEL